MACTINEVATAQAQWIHRHTNTFSTDWLRERMSADAGR